LAARAKDNELNEEEALELNDYLVFEPIVRLAKARATLIVLKNPKV